MRLRKAMDKLGEFYKTQLGQDVIETGTGAIFSAGGQLLFTDMTPEQIAASTALGIGAATVGRPIVGRAGQALGTQLDKRQGVRQFSDGVIKEMREGYGDSSMQALMNAKLAPYAQLSPTAQLGQVLGRGYGDNVAQALVALTMPALVATGEE